MRTALAFAAFSLSAVLFTQTAGSQVPVPPPPPPPPPSAVPAPAQSAPPAAAETGANLTFLAADVRPSPHRRFGGMMGPFLRGDRYLLRQASMRDLVGIAYNVNPGYVKGGPIWLENSKSDIYAKVPPGTTQDQARLMLRRLLQDRFSLVARQTTASAPANVLTVAKDGVKLKPGAGSDDGGCQFKPSGPSEPGASFMGLACHNIAIPAFLQTLHNFIYEYEPGPITDATGLKGTWDFDLKWSNRSQLALAGAEGITIYDALEKQLGLKITKQMQPLPVIMVDSVNETPTPNAPDIATVLPPLPPPQIEVATIKPSQPDERMNLRFMSDQLTIQGATLKFLIYFAWDFSMSNDDVVAGAPKSLDSARYDIQARLATDSASPFPPDFDDMRRMLRDLLIDRFEIKTHTENRPITAFVLTAPNPKLTKADVTTHTRCGNVLPFGAKDPRLADPALDRLVVCQNMTLAQIAEEFQNLDPGYINSDVRDDTGIKGSWDFILAFSSSWVTGAAGGGMFAAPSAPAAGSDPNGAISFFDALNKQLGLKLEKEKRPLPVLVIDHIDEKPTEN